MTVDSAHLPEKQPGSWYAVVLGEPSGSGGSGRFPVPNLGDECVCCNSAHAELSQYDPSTGPYISDPIPIPICTACRDHVVLNEKRAVYVVAAAFVGLGILGFIVHILVSAIGFVVLAAAVGVVVVDRKRQRARSESGHHAGLEFGAAPGILSVRTMNRRIAQRLVEVHPEVDPLGPAPRTRWRRPGPGLSPISSAQSGSPPSPPVASGDRGGLE